MRRERQALVIGIVMLATFFGHLEMTVVITALPTLARTFPSMQAWLPWLTTVSLMAASVALPLAGRLADDWGIKRTFLVGIVLFTLSSLLSGLVGVWLPNRLWLLIAFRVLQGFGGGVFAPVGLKIVSLLYRGRARTTIVGLAGAVGPLAAMLGPNVGGFLADRLPWQSIFLVNVPLGLVIGLAAALFMAETPPRGGSLDAGGALLLSATTLAAMLGFTWMRIHGAASPRALAAVLLACLLGWLLHRLERWHPTPLVDLGLITEKEMAAVVALSFCQGLVMYSTLYFLSFYAQVHPAIQATGSATGMMLSPAALGQVMAAPLVGLLVAKTGYRVMVMGGMGLAALSVLLLATGPTHLAVLGTLLLAVRVGGTMASIPLAAAGLELRRAQAGAITGLRQLSNVLGGIVGPVALAVLVPPAQTPGVGPTGYATVFLALGALLTLMLPVVRLMPEKD